MHIGIVGPIYIPSLKETIKTDVSLWIKGMGGIPVNHQVNALSEKGYKISVFSLTPELETGQDFEWHQDNLSIYVGSFRKRARHRCIDFFGQERKYLKKAILKAKPDVIHAQWQYEWAWAAIDSKIPTLVTCHDSPIDVLKQDKDLYRVIRLMMASIVLRKASHLTAVSPYTALSLRSFTKKNISVIPNFEPDAVFNQFREGKVNQMSPRKPKIAMINNGFHGRKNVASGISGFVEFQKQYPEAELHLFGFGNGINEDAHLWCKSKGIEKGIRFHGSLPFDELIKSLAYSDVLLHTSLEESCPMVVIEAFALGIPVIGGIKSGGVPWMIEENSGYLVDVLNSASISQALVKVCDPKVYAFFSENARQIALQRFSKQAVLNQYIKHYKSILKVSEARRN